MKIIQITAVDNLLVALTDDGEIYRFDKNTVEKNTIIGTTVYKTAVEYSWNKLPPPDDYEFEHNTKE